MKTYTWEIIGCGNVTEPKSGAAYQKTNHFQFSAVMRRDVVKRRGYAKRHDVSKLYADAGQLIKPEIDAINIVTPPDSHEDYALKVATAGKVCCIEKPMVRLYNACITINKTFQDKNLPLCVAYYGRLLQRFTQIKSWLDNNKIGDIDLSKQYNWCTNTNLAPVGYFDDVASHKLDLFSFLLIGVSQVDGIAVNQQKLYAAMDAVT